MSNDEAILFPEADVDGIKVKPWSFGMLFDISEQVQAVIDMMEVKGLTNMIDTSFEAGNIKYTDVAKIFTIAGPHLLRIVAKTTDKCEEDIRALEMSTGIKLVYTIFKQNREVLKNALSPLLN